MPNLSLEIKPLLPKGPLSLSEATEALERAPPLPAPAEPRTWVPLADKEMWPASSAFLCVRWAI